MKTNHLALVAFIFLASSTHIAHISRWKFTFPPFRPFFKTVKQNQKEIGQAKRNTHEKALSSLKVENFSLICKTIVWVSLKNWTSWTITKFHMLRLQVASLWSLFHRVKSQSKGRKSRSAIARGRPARKQVHQDRGCYSNIKFKQDPSASKGCCLWRKHFKKGRQGMQRVLEMIDTSHTKHKLLAKNCNFSKHIKN